MEKNWGFSIKAYFPQIRDATAMAGAIAVILSAIYVMAKGKVTIGLLTHEKRIHFRARKLENKDNIILS